MDLLTVTLTASNAGGSSSKTAAVRVGASYMCQHASWTAGNGVLYDSGGPGGNYANGENCGFLIQPATPGSSITITITSFSTEGGYDYLRIYDGSSEASPQIFSQSGGLATPYNLTANGTAVYIKFYSDYSVIGSGFRLEWVVNP